MGVVIKGAVSSFQQRTEQIWTTIGPRLITVWDFRLERSDPITGKPLPRVAVQMRGRKFIGSIVNGDIVEVSDAGKPGKVVQTRRVRNLTSSADVMAQPVTRYWGLSLIGMIFGLTLFVAIVMSTLFAHRPF